MDRNDDLTETVRSAVLSQFAKGDLKLPIPLESIRPEPDPQAGKCTGPLSFDTDYECIIPCASRFANSRGGILRAECIRSLLYSQIVR